MLMIREVRGQKRMDLWIVSLVWDFVVGRGCRLKFVMIRLFLRRKFVHRLPLIVALSLDEPST